MNPFCEIAVEEAVRLKEKKVVGEITAVSIGPKASAETLRTALAMGADNAIHLETELRTDQELQPLAVAKLLAWITKEKSPSFWLIGKQVRGRDCGIRLCARAPSFTQTTHYPTLNYSLTGD